MDRRARRRPPEIAAKSARLGPARRLLSSLPSKAGGRRRQEDPRMKIRFWGVRGSIPSPGPETALVGGNTSCVEIVAGGSRVILDAGTGLRRLGDELVRQLAETRGEARVESRLETTVLLSHVHWDHIQGLPFFAPLYVPGSTVRVVAGAAAGGVRVEEALAGQMRKPWFPVELSDVAARLTFDDVREGAKFRAGELQATLAKGNHPDAVYAYRLEHEGRSVVYATDTEHYACVDPRLARLAQGADVLIYDAQYLPEEYAGRKGPSRLGWGHSTWEAAVALARAAGVSKLVLFHHDPSRTDEGVAAIEALARADFGDVCAAREGLELDLAAGALRGAA
jgi:phosphoribosyl 1,2-cyclic phosphodiesterase